MSARRLTAGWAVAVALVLGGCGADAVAPSAAVPALADVLDRVDSALADREYDAARTRLERLISTATAAGESGELDPEEVDRIVSAAEQVLAAIPDDATVPAVKPSASPAPAPTKAAPKPAPGKESSSKGKGGGGKGSGGKGKGKGGKGKK